MDVPGLLWHLFSLMAPAASFGSSDQVLLDRYGNSCTFSPGSHFHWLSILDRSFSFLEGLAIPATTLRSGCRDTWKFWISDRFRFRRKIGVFCVPIQTGCIRHSICLRRCCRLFVLGEPQVPYTTASPPHAYTFSKVNRKIWRGQNRQFWCFSLLHRWGGSMVWDLCAWCVSGGSAAALIKLTRSRFLHGWFRVDTLFYPSIFSYLDWKIQRQDRAWFHRGIYQSNLRFGGGRVLSKVRFL